MKAICVFTVAVLCFATNAVPQVYMGLSPYGATMPAIRKAIEGKRSFSLPWFRSTVVYADGIASEDSHILRLSGVSLKTGDIYVEADGLEYDWDSREAKLIGSAKVLAASRPSTNN